MRFTISDNVSRQAAALRYDAQLAYRDGRTMRARKLNAMADSLEAVDRYPASAAADLARISALGTEGALVITRRQPSFERAITTGADAAAVMTLVSIILSAGLLWFYMSADTASAYAVITADN
jgi:hypothetical protein